MWLAETLQLPPAHAFDPNRFMPLPVRLAAWEQSERIVDELTATMRAAVLACIEGRPDPYAIPEQLEQAIFDRFIARRDLLEPFVVE